MMATTSSSTASASCSAVTLTVCAVFQLPVVNVRVVLSSDSSVSAIPPMVTVTSPAGSESSATV